MQTGWSHFQSPRIGKGKGSEPFSVANRGADRGCLWLVALNISIDLGVAVKSIRLVLIASLLVLAGCAGAPTPTPTPAPTPEEAKQQEQAATAAMKSMFEQFTGSQPITAATYPEAQYGRFASLLTSLNRDLPPIQKRLSDLQAKQRSVGQPHVNDLSTFANETDRTTLLDDVHVMRGVLTGLMQLFHDFLDDIVKDVQVSALTETEKREFSDKFVAKMNADMVGLDAEVKLSLQLLDIYEDMFRIAEADKPQWIDSKLRFNSPDADQKFHADMGRIKPLRDQLSALKAGTVH